MMKQLHLNFLKDLRCNTHFIQDPRFMIEEKFGNTEGGRKHGIYLMNLCFWKPFFVFCWSKYLSKGLHRASQEQPATQWPHMLLDLDISVDRCTCQAKQGNLTNRHLGWFIHTEMFFERVRGVAVCWMYSWICDLGMFGLHVRSI